MGEYKKTEQMIVDEVSKALSSVQEDEVEEYIRLISQAEKVFFIGVGRVKLALECIAKRYAHLGIKVVVVGETTEPAITEKDVLIVGSGSGETIVPLGIARRAKAFHATIIHIGSNPKSSMSAYEDLFIRIPVKSRAKRPDEIDSKQPMTSLFEQTLLLFGDTTACMLISRNHIDMNDIWSYHANLE